MKTIYMRIYELTLTKPAPVKPQLDKESDPQALNLIKDKLLIYLEKEDTDAILALARENGFEPDFLDFNATKAKAKEKGTPGLFSKRRSLLRQLCQINVL